MREPLMQADPYGAIGAGGWPRRIELPSRRMLAACVAAATTLAVVLALVAANVASVPTGAPVLRGREVQTLTGRGIAGLPRAEEIAVSRALGADSRAFWARPADGGLVAHSHPLGLTTRFTRSGVAVSTSAGTVGLSLVAAGAGRLPGAVGPVSPVAHANRVVYARAGLSEWYANGPLGLEQGLTVSRAPRAGAGSRLSFDFALSGPLAPTLHGDTVSFRDRAGRSVLSYADLQVTDAHGRRLPAHIALSGRRLILRVDAAGARYPLTVDPMLTPSGGGGTTAQFGYSVASSGTTLVVGAPNAGGGSSSSSSAGPGAAYVFVEPATGWASATQNAALTATAGQAGDELGYQVAIAATPTGTTVFAGAPYAAGGGSASGAAYVFTEPATGWGSAGATVNQAAMLSAPGSVGTTLAAATSPTTGLASVVLGSPGASGGGAAYVFQEPSSGAWASGSSPTATLADAAASSLGSSIAIADSPTTGLATVVAGAPNSNSGAGQADVYQEAAGGWSGAPAPSSSLAETGGGSSAELGYSVAITMSSSGATTVLAGAPYANVGAGTYDGAAYVYTEPPGGAWPASADQTAELTSSSPTSYDQFGDDVATNGSAAFVADYGVSKSGGGSTAGIWDFAEPSGGWSGEIADPADLTYDGDSSYSNGLLAVESDSSDSSDQSATEFLGQPGDGDVDVNCPDGGACPAETTTDTTPTDTTTTDTTTTDTTTTSTTPMTPRASRVSVTCKATGTAGKYTCPAIVADASGKSPAEVPTKTLTFSAGKGKFGSGACTLAATGASSAGCTVSYLAPSSAISGGATIVLTAAYPGDANFTASSGGVTLKIPAKTCTVPKLVGKTESAAKTALKKANCAVGKITTTKKSTLAKGRVTASTPKAGTKHKKGTKVALVLSPGPARCTVPKLVGKTESAAKTALKKANCAVGKITTTKKSTLAKGRVTASTPKAGTKHKKGTKVALTVSAKKA